MARNESKIETRVRKEARVLRETSFYDFLPVVIVLCGLASGTTEFVWFCPKLEDFFEVTSVAVSITLVGVAVIELLKVFAMRGALQLFFGGAHILGLITVVMFYCSTAAISLWISIDGGQDFAVSFIANDPRDEIVSQADIDTRKGEADERMRRLEGKYEAVDVELDSISQIIEGMSNPNATPKNFFWRDGKRHMKKSARKRLKDIERIYSMKVDQADMKKRSLIARLNKTREDFEVWHGQTIKKNKDRLAMYEEDKDHKRLSAWRIILVIELLSAVFNAFKSFGDYFGRSSVEDGVSLENQVVSMYTSGISRNQIVSELGIQDRKIRRILAKYDVQIRDDRRK